MLSELECYCFANATCGTCDYGNLIFKEFHTHAIKFGANKLNLEIGRLGNEDGYLLEELAIITKPWHFVLTTKFPFAI
jgi:hypothetical protein